MTVLPAGQYVFEGAVDRWSDWRPRLNLALHLGLNHLRTRYQASSLGFLWTLLNPLLMMLVYSFLFSIVFRAQIPGGINYASFFLSGYLMWNAVLLSMNNNVYVIEECKMLITTNRFPVWALPLSRVLSAFLNFLLTLPVLLLFNGAMGIWPGWGLLVLPYTLLLGFLLAAGVGLLVACWNPFFRDLGQIIEIVQILIYFSAPILYPYALVEGSDLLPGWALHVYGLNPLTGLIELLHFNLLGMHIALLPVVAASIGCPLIFAFGVWSFARKSREFSYVL